MTGVHKTTAPHTRSAGMSFFFFFSRSISAVDPPVSLLRSQPRSPLHRPLRQNVEKLARAMSAATSVSLAVADAVWAEIKSAGQASDEHLSM